MLVNYPGIIQGINEIRDQGWEMRFNRLNAT
jgi:hypothetical protein